MNAVLVNEGTKSRSNLNQISSSGAGGGGGALNGGNINLDTRKGMSANAIANGGGGGGFLGDGGDGWTSGFEAGNTALTQEVVGGKSFLAGGAGGYAGRNRDTSACPSNAATITRPPGGFGGGGASWYGAGGGGGFCST